MIEYSLVYYPLACEIMIMHKVASKKFYLKLQNKLLNCYNNNNNNNYYITVVISNYKKINDLTANKTCNYCVPRVFFAVISILKTDTPYLCL